MCIFFLAFFFYGTFFIYEIGNLQSWIKAGPFGNLRQIWGVVEAATLVCVYV
jgi:hypothetical protein